MESLWKRMAVGITVVLAVLAIGWWSWRTFANTRRNAACSPDKITLKLDQFDPNGHLLGQDAGAAVDYEFCIPYADQPLQEIHQIDPTISCQNGLSGRIGCTDDEYLCIGNTANKNAMGILCELSLLGYVERIDQTFWE